MKLMPLMWLAVVLPNWTQAYAATETKAFDDLFGELEKVTISPVEWKGRPIQQYSSNDAVGICRLVGYRLVVDQKITRRNIAPNETFFRIHPLAQDIAPLSPEELTVPPNDPSWKSDFYESITCAR